MANKYRVLRGNHSHGQYPQEHPWAGRPIVYEIGEIIETDVRLEKFNVPGPLGPKFQRVYHDLPATDKLAQATKIAQQQEASMMGDDGNGPFGPQAPPDDGLDGMGVQELRRLAKEEGVELPGGSVTKEDLVRLIRGAAASVG